MGTGMKKALEGALVAGLQAAMMAVVGYMSVPDHLVWSGEMVDAVLKMAVTQFATGILIYYKQPVRDEAARDRATDKYTR